ncbi:hypothetical protein Ddc_06841 [Ditylenchus destructor]|nr:hypothetical protein Ddc_06841 [Ditylenchus destructor]
MRRKIASPPLFIAIILLIDTSDAQNSTRKCGLPKNIEVFPDFAQDEIRAVWKDYTPGQDCKKQLLITEDIFTVLEMFDKEVDNKQPPGIHSGVSTTTLHSKYLTNESPPSPPTQTISSSSTSASDKSPAAIIVNSDYNDLAATETSKDTTTSIPVVSTQPSSVTVFPKQVQPAQWQNEGSKQARVLDVGNYDNEEDVNLPPPRSTTSETRSSPATRNTYGSGTKLALPYGDKVRRISTTRIPHDYDYATSAETSAQNNKPAVGFSKEGRSTRLEAPKRKTKRPPEPLYEQNDHLPFLKGATDDVVRAFQDTFDDPNIPSESRRMEEIHLLAVSYLNARQLALFNAWSSDRRKRIRAREQQHLHRLSRDAQHALKTIVLTEGGSREKKVQVMHFPSHIRYELKSYAQDRLRDAVKESTQRNIN